MRAILVSLCVLLACGDDGPPPLPPLVTIAVNAGDAQQAIAGSPVTTPPSVLVTDREGAPVAGASVTFAVMSGGGSITGATQTTNDSGVATLGGWTLGVIAGTNALVASASDLTDVQATIRAAGTAGAATRLAFNAASSTGVVGTAVTVPPSVIALDANGNAVANVAVTFAVTGGGGGHTGANQTTDLRGIATVGSWTLGTLAGTNTIVATSAGLAGSPVTITSLGMAAGPARIDAYSGSLIGTPARPLDTPPSVLVRDANGNPVSGAMVTFAVASGGGSITGGAQTTGAGGVATVGGWTLGSAVGVNTATATVIGVAPLTLTADMYASVVGSCALSTAGRAFCWGANYSGQVGDGSKLERRSPVAVTGGMTFVTLASATSANCALTNTGTPYCWGDNYDGVLGDGTQTSRAVPGPVSGGHVFSSLSGGNPMCGVNGVGPAYCWGSNYFGALGDGSYDQSTGTGPQFSSTPVAVAGGLTFAEMGVSSQDVKCGLTTAGAGYCWGYGGQGELGNGGSQGSSTPVLVFGGFAFSELAPSQVASCGLVNGAAYCWGYNYFGTVGDGTIVDRHTPVPVVGGLTFTRISTGYIHACALTSAGAAYCWGGNRNGEVGDGTKIDRRTPVLVAGGHTFAAIRAGTDSTCGVTTGHELYCWGDNSQGRLGDGTAINRLVPTRVLPAAIQPAALTIAPQQLPFDHVGGWGQNFFVQNTGTVPTGPLHVTLGGAQADQFYLIALGSTCEGTNLAPGAQCEINAGFNPTSSGQKSAVLSVSGAPGGTASTPLASIGP